jgi:IS605 OrfB family transposase
MHADPCCRPPDPGRAGAGGAACPIPAPGVTGLGRQLVRDRHRLWCLGVTGTRFAVAVLFRTARIALRVTPAQRRRCFGLLGSGGDVWAAVIDVNQARFRRQAKPIFGYENWCREIAGVTVGELSQTAIRSVVRRYSDACLVTAARKRAGRRARYPRRKRGLVPLRWHSGTFRVEDQRVRLQVAQGARLCWVRLARPVPYPIELLRSVTLLVDAGRLVLDVTAGLDVQDHDLDSDRVAGVDLGIIHPIAAAIGDQGLLVSGRAVRAEERLHLADTKARARKMAPKAPRRGQRGSRRWRQLRAKQRCAEAASKRRVRQAHHEAAKQLVEWAVAQRVGTLVVGDPRGITQKDVGPVHNRRLRTWRRTHLMGAITDKAALAGITVKRVDERGTSSTCPNPACRLRVPKPSGRNFSCPHCGYRGHRDLVGAHNIAADRGGTNTSIPPVLVEHRRVGTPTQRRDRRRHLMDEHRSCPVSGRPATHNGESLADPPTCEDQPTRTTAQALVDETLDGPGGDA